MESLARPNSSGALQPRPTSELRCLWGKRIVCRSKHWQAERLPYNFLSHARFYARRFMKRMAESRFVSFVESR
jgi:hypothetical protein